jgi:plasmid stability protein
MPAAAPAVDEDLSPISSLSRSLGYGAPPRASVSGSSIIDKLLKASSEDIPYLRAAPYTATEEQAMREQMRANVQNEYATALQRLRDEMGARQGMSGPLMEREELLGEEQRQRLSDIDRDLMIRAAGERRSRLAESRGILGELEQLERQRQREAMGIETGLSDYERQTLLDLLGAIGGLAPNLGTAGGVASEAARTAGVASYANQSGIRDIAALIQQLQ